MFHSFLWLQQNHDSRRRRRPCFQDTKRIQPSTAYRFACPRPSTPSQLLDQHFDMLQLCGRLAFKAKRAKRCCRDSQVFCFTRNLHLGRPTTKPGVLRRWEAAKEGTLAHTCSTAEPPFARRRSVTVSVLEASNPKLHDRIAFTKGSSCGFLEEKRQKLPVASDRSVRSNGHVRHVRNAAPFASLPPLRTMPRSSETRTKDRLDESTTGTERGDAPGCVRTVGQAVPSSGPARGLAQTSGTRSKMNRKAKMVTPDPSGTGGMNERSRVFQKSPHSPLHATQLDRSS